MSEIAFQVDEFRSYKIAAEGISFGFIDTGTGTYNPQKGESVSYDGTTVVLKDGRTYSNVPQLRSAIREGWLVPTDEVAIAPRPKPAGVLVRGTEQQGSARPTMSIPQTLRSEEQTVGNVEERKRQRERNTEVATRKGEPNSGRKATLGLALAPIVGRSEIDEIAALLDVDAENWLFSRKPQKKTDSYAKIDEDLLEILNSIESLVVPVLPTPSRASRNMPIEREENTPRFPLMREDIAENSGTVISAVQSRKSALIEREKEIAFEGTPATPTYESPKPTPRIGGTGVIVVDEDRDLGNIALSDTRSPISMSETAKVSSNTSSSIMMGETAQVGGRHKTRIASGDQEGIAVGRILSPAVQSFTASPENTSSTAINQAEANLTRVEKLDHKPLSAVATGDVEEAISGETLEELLPNAVKPNVAKPPRVYLSPENDPAYAAVKMMLPEFTWNRDRQLSERVEEAKKYLKDPAYLRGILAVETDIGREAIKKIIVQAVEKTEN